MKTIRKASFCFLFVLTISCLVERANGLQPTRQELLHAWESYCDQAVELYQWLHEHPEISLEEKNTAAHLASVWTDAGLKVTTQVGGHGIVGLFENGDGPTVMLRTDLDALPIDEETSLPYASKNKGAMHACGHDIHMTNVTTVARYLIDNQAHWQGTLLVIGQPAEERGLGAKMMIVDGLLKRFPKPDVGLAIHVDSTIPPQVIKTAAGYIGASSDSIDIIVKGQGGHGSAPHTTIDPIVQAADLIMSLQTIVSREIKPTDAAVVTVGAIMGGTKHNIIPNECSLQLTVRSHSEEVRAKLVALIRQRAKGIAQAYGAPEPSIELTEGVPALTNDAEIATRLQPVFVELLGQENVQGAERTMGFEDFSQFSAAGIPTLMFAVGSVSEERLQRYKQQGGVPSLHSSKYFPDVEPTLRTAFMTSVAAMIVLFSSDDEDLQAPVISGDEAHDELVELMRKQSLEKKTLRSPTLLTRDELLRRR